MPSSRRVVVTGLGAVTPLGNTVPEFWANVVAGKSGVREITLFDASGMPTRIAGEVRGFEPADLIGKKEARRMDRFAQFAFVAAREAVADAKLAISDANRDRIGVIFASGIGGILTLEDQHKILLERGPDRVSPFFPPVRVGKCGAGQFSKGPPPPAPPQTTVPGGPPAKKGTGAPFPNI